MTIGQSCMFGGRAARAHTRTHARAQPISLPFLPPDSRFPMTDLHYLVPNRGFEEGSLQSLAYMAVARARGCNAIGWNNVPYKEVHTSHIQAPPGPFPPAGQARARARAHAPMHTRGRSAPPTTGCPVNMYRSTCTFSHTF